MEGTMYVLLNIGFILLISSFCIECYTKRKMKKKQIWPKYYQLRTTKRIIFIIAILMVIISLISIVNNCNIDNQKSPV